MRRESVARATWDLGLKWVTRWLKRQERTPKCWNPFAEQSGKLLREVLTQKVGVSSPSGKKQDRRWGRVGKVGQKWEFASQTLVFFATPYTWRDRKARKCMIKLAF